MKKIVQISFIFCLSILLRGCAKPLLIFNEPLTGMLCCKTRANKLQSSHNGMSAEFMLKTCAETMTRNGPLHAILKVIHLEEKTYDFTAMNHILLKINGEAYPIKVISLLNNPTIQVKRHFIPLPTGNSIQFGIPKDITIKTLVLLLPYDTFAKLANAQEAIFELPNLKKSPVFFKFVPKNLKIIKEFKAQCIDQQPTRKQ